MRLLAGMLLLLALFAGALAWQNRADRPGATLASTPDPDRAQPYPSDWGRVVLGRPSGAEAWVDETAQPAPTLAASVAPAPGPAQAQPGAPTPAPRPAQREFELTVQAGQSLSVICKSHYGSARAELVQALARYNGVADPSRIKAGARLKLPPLEQLTAR